MTRASRGSSIPRMKSTRIHLMVHKKPGSEPSYRAFKNKKAAIDTAISTADEASDGHFNRVSDPTDYVLVYDAESKGYVTVKETDLS